MLLLDQNLSPRLVGRLADLFPASTHVATVGLAESADETVWDYAAANGRIVVTKDSDFNDLAVLAGPPPHVVWIQRGNCSTAELEELLRARADAISGLVGSTTAVLILV